MARGKAGPSGKVGAAEPSCAPWHLPRYSCRRHHVADICLLLIPSHSAPDVVNVGSQPMFCYVSQPANFGRARGVPGSLAWKRQDPGWWGCSVQQEDHLPCWEEVGSQLRGCLAWAWQERCAELIL